MFSMHQEMDLEMDPNSIKPRNGMIIVKRDKETAKVGLIHRPEQKISYNGAVMAVAPGLCGDVAALEPGDYVYLDESEINVQNSIFFKWAGDDYLMVPAKFVAAVGKMQEC